MFPALVAFAACIATPGGWSEKDLPSYFTPPPVGSRLQYRETRSNGLRNDSTEAITAVRVGSAGTVVTIRDDEGNDNDVLIDKTGLSQLHIRGVRLHRPWRFIKLPSHWWGGWDTRPQAFWDSWTRFETTVTGPELVEVPAGRFRAVRVDLKCREFGKLNHIGTYWYAAGVGQVKRVTGDYATVVLTSFSPGPDYCEVSAGPEGVK